MSQRERSAPLNAGPPRWFARSASRSGAIPAGRSSASPATAVLPRARSRSRAVLQRRPIVRSASAGSSPHTVQSRGVGETVRGSDSSLDQGPRLGPGRASPFVRCSNSAVSSCSTSRPSSRSTAWRTRSRTSAASSPLRAATAAVTARSTRCTSSICGTRPSVRRPPVGAVREGRFRGLHRGLHHLSRLAHIAHAERLEIAVPAWTRGREWACWDRTGLQIGTFHAARPARGTARSCTSCSNGSFVHRSPRGLRAYRGREDRDSRTFTVLHLPTAEPRPLRQSGCAGTGGRTLSGVRRRARPARRHRPPVVIGRIAF